MSGAARAVLRLRIGRAAASRAAAALRPDDDAYVATRAEGDALIVEVTADRLPSLLRALEDVLANAAVSEDLLRTGPMDDA